MTDKVSYNLPSYNPFAAAAESNVYKGAPLSQRKQDEEQRKKEEAERKRKDKNYSELNAHLEAVNKLVRKMDFNDNDVQNILFGKLLNLSHEREILQNYADGHKIAYNNIDLVELVATNHIGSTAGRKNKPPVTSLQDMPEGDGRTQLAANIYADELERSGRKLFKKADDARNRHYFPTERQEQDEMILGAKAWNLYLEPTYNDKFTGDWCDMFDHFIEQARKDNKDWTENPYFVRKYKYDILSDGTTASKYEFENNSILGSSIFDRIRDVIFISDCLPFMRKAWINENKTRFKMIREQKNNIKTFTKRKKPQKVVNIKSKTRQAAMELQDPDEYDDSLDIHGDPVRRPPDSLTHLKNIKEEYDAIPEAFRLNLMNKDDPENYTKYVNALTDYWKVVGKDEQFIQHELQKLRDDRIKF